MIALFFILSLALIGLLLFFRSPRLNDAAGVLYAVGFAGFAGWLAFNDADFAGYLKIDDLGRWFLLVLAVLNLCSALNNLEYMKHLKLNARSHTFYWVSYIAFIICMAGVILSAHLGILWVFIETSTLVTAYLINITRTKASLEAVWKYLFICSVGISLAFVGIVFLSLALTDEGRAFFRSPLQGHEADEPALAQARLRVHPHRLRNEDGPRPGPCLAARRPLRVARADLRPPLGNSPQYCFHRHPPGLPARRFGRGGRFRQDLPGRHGLHFPARRRDLCPPRDEL